MVKNYLRLAWRSVTRNKSFSAINIFGLSLGIATSLLIFLWVRDERAVDGFHANGPSMGTALHSPGDIAVSRSLAEYFFGSPEAAIGKTIRFEDQEALRVTAVFENLPSHSSLQFDFLRSWAGLATLVITLLTVAIKA